MSFFILFDQCKFEVYFVRYNYCYFCLFSGAIGLVNLLPAFHTQLVFISVNKMDLLQTTDCHIFDCVQLNQCYSLIICLFFSCGLMLPVLLWFCLLSSSVCRIPCRIFCSDGLVVIYCFSFYLLWIIFITPTILSDSLVGRLS
jgi:hypothetical protein